MKFCEMLRQEGKVGDDRIIGSRTLDLMTRNHLTGGDLSTMAVGAFSETAYDGVGFGLGFAMTLDEVATGSMGCGDYYWGGAASTIFWVDPEEDLVVVFMTQLMPSATFNFPRSAEKHHLQRLRRLKGEDQAEIQAGRSSALTRISVSTFVLLIVIAGQRHGLAIPHHVEAIVPENRPPEVDVQIEGVRRTFRVYRGKQVMHAHATTNQRCPKAGFLCCFQVVVDAVALFRVTDHDLGRQRMTGQNACVPPGCSAPAPGAPRPLGSTCPGPVSTTAASL